MNANASVDLKIIGRPIRINEFGRDWSFPCLPSAAGIGTRAAPHRRSWSSKAADRLGAEWPVAVQEQLRTGRTTHHDVVERVMVVVADADSDVARRRDEPAS